MLKIVEKPKYLTDFGYVEADDIIELAQSLSPSMWDKENTLKENKYDCFHHTKHIIFRFIKNNRDPRDFYSNTIWEMVKPRVQPILLEIAAHYQYVNPVFPKVMLAQLQAGYSIDTHTDGANACLHTHKIHLPLITDPAVKFIISDRSFHLETSHAYEVNNIARHGVVNNSSVDRIHLIFEMYDDPDAASKLIS